MMTDKYYNLIQWGIESLQHGKLIEDVVWSIGILTGYRSNQILCDLDRIGKLNLIYVKEIPHGGKYDRLRDV